MRLLIPVAAAAVASCYAPAIAPCQYSCDGDACPSGLTCNASIQMCVAAAADTCTGSGLDSGSGSGSSCWAATNVDPCKSGTTMVTTSWTLPSGGTKLLTDSATSSTPVPTGVKLGSATQLLGPAVMLIEVDELHVPANAMIEVSGGRPLIILANGAVTIDGEIDVEPGGGSSGACTTGHGADSASAPEPSGGGGGGSFGAPIGADGGSSATGATGGSAGAANADPDLAPLRGGCAGGLAGVAEGSGTVTLGGLGGGAIQISSAVSITVTGVINAPGDGGASNTSFAGGGGGGAGGAVFLEAPIVELGSQAHVCANGGGGGASRSSVGGQRAACSDPIGAAPGGGSGTSRGGSGAFGSSGATTPARDAGGGGGGGGGVGRIRLHGATTVTVDGNAVVSPPPAP